MCIYCVYADYVRNEMKLFGEVDGNIFAYSIHGTGIFTNMCLIFMVHLLVGILCIFFNGFMLILISMQRCSLKQVLLRLNPSHCGE